MPREDQARGEGDNHEHDKVALARPIGTAVEDNRNREHHHAQGESHARLDQADARLKNFLNSPPSKPYDVFDGCRKPVGRPQYRASISPDGGNHTDIYKIPDRPGSVVDIALRHYDNQARKASSAAPLTC